MMMSIKCILLLLALAQASNAFITCEETPYSDAVRSGASDVIVVRQPDGTLKATPFHLQIGRFSSFFSFWLRRTGQAVSISINGVKGPQELVVSDSGSTCFQKEDGSSNDEWTSEDWSQMNLNPGVNNADYEIPSLGIDIPFKVYLFEQDAKFVVTDIDGTITESDVKGQLFSSFGVSAHHFNVVPFFKRIHEQGYQIVYLTSRSISQDDATRGYLFTTLSNLGLPRGPLLMTPKPLAEAILESTVGSPREAKAANLRDFFSLFENGAGVIKGAYGNIKSDSEAYQDAGIPKSRIYLINPEGRLRREDGEVGVSTYENDLANIDSIYPNLN